MPVFRMRLGSVICFAVLAAASPGRAEDRYQLGVRGVVTTADGEPANDILAAGLFGRFRLNQRWLVGVAVESAEYDFERPASVVGVEQSREVEVIDASTSSTIVSSWIEREYGRPDTRWKRFWSAGLGVGEPEVADASGPTASGGRFEITTDAGTEIVALLAAGLRAEFARHWSLETALRVDHHVADWKVRDRVSGRTGSLDDYTALGFHIGLAYRFE